MEKVVQESTSILVPAPEKKKRGRPRKHPFQNTTLPKRGRGRPRKHPIQTETSVKRGRGRPRKYPIGQKEMLPNGEVRASFKKVDSCHLLKHMLNYFTKLMIVHSQLAKNSPQHEVVFHRLKNLDFQMAEVCRTVLVREFGYDQEQEQDAA